VRKEHNENRNLEEVQDINTYFEMRQSREKEEIEVVDTYQVMVGTLAQKTEESNFIQVSEERGSLLTLPFQDVEFDIKTFPHKRLFIKTRNYIEYHPDTMQASYTDCRFLKMVNIRRVFNEEEEN